MTSDKAAQRSIEKDFTALEALWEAPTAKLPDGLFASSLGAMGLDLPQEDAGRPLLLPFEPRIEPRKALWAQIAGVAAAVLLVLGMGQFQEKTSGLFLADISQELWQTMMMDDPAYGADLLNSLSALDDLLTEPGDDIVLMEFNEEFQGLQSDFDALAEEVERF